MIDLSTTHKTTRNTIFTLVILGLAAWGLNWNRQVSESFDPVQISEVVLAAAQSSEPQPFPLTVKFSKPHLKLGQYQELQIATSPNARLEIATIYPNGHVSSAQTLVATSDQAGRYTLRFRLDDFAYLGVFETRVVARVDTQQSHAIGRFALQTLKGIEASSSDEPVGYVYPLLP